MMSATGQPGTRDAPRLYLDLCAWKRPYDVAIEERVRLEALAVSSLLEAALNTKVVIVSSATLEAENARNPNPLRRAGVASVLKALPEVVPLADETVARAEELQRLGFRPLDALHVASAEGAACAFFVTTDDRLAAAMRRNAAALRVRLADPLEMVRVLEGMTA
jgi:predicted nucleic acid-binding protein